MIPPEDLSPRKAWQRYLDARSPETTSQSQKTYHYRLKLWVEWCEANQIETVSELNGWVFESFKQDRAGAGLAPTTLQGEMQTLKNYVQFLERIEAVDEDLAEKVDVPHVAKRDQSSNIKLDSEAAASLLTYFRNSSAHRAQNYHAALEVLWHVGARMGGFRALDLRDFDADAQLLDFNHRPETGTPLKKKEDGERMVGLRSSVANILSEYIQKHRPDSHDDAGRQPLFATAQGRVSSNAFRSWCYYATLPCHHGPCPHGKQRETCDWVSHNHSSKCPSSRSPHQVRTGSITWHRDRGVPREVTADRTNASEETIDKHYDKPLKRQSLERRRRPHLEKLSLEEGTEHD